MFLSRVYLKCGQVIGMAQARVVRQLSNLVSLTYSYGARLFNFIVGWYCEGNSLLVIMTQVPSTLHGNSFPAGVLKTVRQDITCKSLMNTLKNPIQTFPTALSISTCKHYAIRCCALCSVNGTQWVSLNGIKTVRWSLTENN